MQRGTLDQGGKKNRKKDGHTTKLKDSNSQLKTIIKNTKDKN
jgi:hypothetical protein